VYVSQRSLPHAILTILFFLCCSVVSLHAAPTQVIDQQNTGQITGTNGGTSFGQSFTPTLSGIDYIEVLMGGSGDIVTVDILDGIIGFDGLGGPVIGTSNPTLVNTIITQEIIPFDFPSTVSLTPGNTYVFRLQTPGGIEGVSWTDDSYIGGQYLAENYATTSYVQGHDLLFEEGMMVSTAQPVPAPSALAICIVGANLVTWLRRRKSL